MATFLSEIEATTYAGVSAGTLARFAEAGYLKTQKSGEGKLMYSKDELSTIFGGAATSNPKTQPNSTTSSKVTINQSMANTTKPVEKPATEDKRSAESDARTNEKRLDWQNIDSLTSAASEELGAETPEKLKPEKDNSDSKLKFILDSQDKLLAEKDKTIKNLEDQVTWLRERVTFLEEQARRDQILLLSKSQTIHELVIRRKESTIGSFLGWLKGIALPESTSQQKKNSSLIESAKTNK